MTAGVTTEQQHAPNYEGFLECTRVEWEHVVDAEQPSPGGMQPQSLMTVQMASPIISSFIRSCSCCASGASRCTDCCAFALLGSSSTTCRLQTFQMTRQHQLSTINDASPVHHIFATTDLTGATDEAFHLRYTVIIVLLHAELSALGCTCNQQHTRRPPHGEWTIHDLQALK